MSYSPAHPDANGLKTPLLWSVGFHTLLFSSLAFSAFFSHRGDTWGGPGGDNGVSVGLVAKLPGVNLPQPDAVTTSRVVDTTKGLYKAEPPPKPEVEPPDTKTIPEFTKEKAPHYITKPSKILEDKSPPPPPNAVPYGGGGSPALPYSQSFAVAGQTQGGMGFSGPGGGDFAGKFPSYVDGVRNRISANWLQSSVDQSIRWAPRAQFSFQILRDGTVTNIQRTQSSGNQQVDNSMMRAILSSNPMSGLPSNYSGNSVTVEFWFEFRR